MRRGHFYLYLAAWGLPGTAAAVLAHAIVETGFSPVTVLCGALFTSSIGLVVETMRAWHKLTQRSEGSRDGQP